MRQRRQALHYTQKRLAGELGVAYQQLARWESDNANPTTETLVQLSQALNCTTDWLLGLVDELTAHVQERELSDDERRLVEMYRRGELPALIQRLVTELARHDVQEDPVVDGPRQTDIAARDETLRR